MRVVDLEEPVLVGREAEEPVLFLDPLRRRQVNRAEPVLGQLLLGLELLTADAIPACVDVLVDVAVVVHPLKELADEALVPVVARADEEVGLGVQPRRQVAPRDGDAVRILLRLEPLLFGHPPDLRRVLVDAGEEERVRAALPLVANKHVANRRRVGVADAGRRVDVVDRCGQVEAHATMIRGSIWSTFAPREASGCPTDVPAERWLRQVEHLCANDGQVTASAPPRGEGSREGDHGRGTVEGERE